MKLKELVHWNECQGDPCGGGDSPAFWIDEDTGDYFFQGYKVDQAARDAAKCPGHEDLVRVPASFWEQLKGFAK